MYPSTDHGTGKRWQVRYRDLSGKQCKENFDKKTAAESRAAKVTSELDGGTFVNRELGKQKFRVIAERWQETAVHRERTETNVERALRLHIYPTFGNREIGRIQRADGQKWIKERSAAIAPSTFATPWNVCTSILKMAHQEGIIAKYPWEGLKPPEVFYPEIHPLHPEAVRALIATASPRYRALVRQAASTGLRQGELFGLEDEEPAETVTVKQQLIGPDKGVPYLGEPKTRQSYRPVPQGHSVVDAIVRHRQEFPPRVVHIEDRTNPRKPVWRHARLLYTSETGGAIRRGSWAKVWARNVKRANAHLGKSGSKVRVPEDATLHDLRHFYASVLIKNGATPKQVQKRLGHAKPSITLNVYTHLWEAEEDRTAGMMEATLGDVP
ncbi:tyrosine-type recombinase/integrase [Streptomyces phaeochromogenes]|uniref:tyrosine-type recombinase/integrase n=1 Tax=Streptomyces phaeochromogenes TaxID=1923 RepID=UPI002E148256|nr:tyrosine-type recombinase/integrase [Streptomyces phaeochromogenes]WSJ05257.1 site-specific integrase [Streptomyces phaeochromogenes]